MRRWSMIVVLGAPGSAAADEPHRVHGGWATVGSYQQLAFTFEVTPPIGGVPAVRRLPEVPGEPAVTLEVAQDDRGRYTVVVGELSELEASGRLLIEVPNGDRLEPHRADFTVRTHRGERTAHPSRDGRLVLVPAPTSLADDTSVLIGQVELPLDPLPGGVEPGAVLAAASVEWSADPASFDGWMVDFAALHAAPRLFWRPIGSDEWKELGARSEPDQAEVVGEVLGAGTWLVVGGGEP